MVMPRGVSLGELERVADAPGFDTNKEFSKKTDKVSHIFLIIGIVAGLLIIGLILLRALACRRPQIKKVRFRDHETAPFKSKKPGADST